MIDCFSFFNELDLLEIRLNSLAPYVERFVLSECPVTHTGKSKPLYFQENKERFKDFNITHLIVSGYENLIGKNPWKIEKYQREYIMNGIEDVDQDCIILLSDLDEIPNLEVYKKSSVGVFIQKVYYYYLNTYTGGPSSGTVAIRRGDIFTLNDARNKRVGPRNRIHDGGWHFSTLGPTNNVLNKINSFAHQEFNIPEVKDKTNENLNNLLDPYGRSHIRFEVGMPSGPKWLLDNKDRYSHLFYKGNNDSVSA